MSEEITDYAKATFEQITEFFHKTLVEWNHEKKTVLTLFKAQLKTEWTRFLNTEKGHTLFLQILWNKIEISKNY
ncbi:hypothetical protein BH747_09630 [Enterococcus villorum]|uniref:Uncharacterized protein n=1 Tax=Enterococcus villorum TaxID=112904 RepID=A0A1V8YA72_9ENTE|nr:hypothetical protein [Enterococcus villorum]OQO69524.1 hypothetical protein BH747_09630 [Enterococcus villorum]OQO73705.1 hypothetical protein BH744_09180 [Enterococcus villorum]